MEWHCRYEQARAATAQQQGVERSVERDHQRHHASGEHKFPADQAHPKQDRRTRAGPIAPTEIQSGRPGTGLEDELQPWHTSLEEIGLRHAPQRPLLEMLSLNRRVEQNATSGRVKTHPQFDVLDRGPRESLFVEAAEVEEHVTADRAQPSPKRSGDACALLMNVMVQQVPKLRNEACDGGIVVVRAEESCESFIPIECAPDSVEHVSMDFDVGIHEDQNIAARLPRSKISRRCGTKMMGAVDDDQLFGTVCRAFDRCDHPTERRSPVRRGNHGAESGHLLSVGTNACAAIRCRRVMSSAIDHKRRAIEQWTADPCGPIVDDPSRLLTARRDYAPFMADVLDYATTRGLSVLDVGCGQGIDLCEYGLAGAKVTGVDLTPRHVELACRNLEALGLDGTVIEGDAENLPFPDESFDRVSSNGVLHHTPDVALALREIHRVLRPGGRAIIVVYNRDSGHYWVEQVLRFGALHGHLLQEHTMSNVLSRNVEDSSIGARPLVRVYSRGSFRRLLGDAGFGNVTVRVSPFRAADTFLTRHLPSSVKAALSTLPLGWYLTASAERPHAPMSGLTMSCSGDEPNGPSGSHRFD